MIIGARPQRPVELAIRLCNWDIVDAGLAAHHQSAFVETPLFVAIGAEPFSGGVMIFVLEPRGDLVFMESPDLFDQPVFQFSVPLGGQKGHDGLAPLQEF